MPFPSITCIQTPGLSIIPVTGDHLDDLLEVNGDDEVTRFLPYKTWLSVDDGQAWLTRMKALAEAGSAQQLVLQRRSDGKAIGTVLLFKYDEGSKRIELGYVLGRNYWGQGFMREALRATVDHVVSVLDIRRIEAEVNPANIASCKLLSQLGFHYEGTFRQRWTAKGATYDTNMYGLLAEDWRGASHAT